MKKRRGVGRPRGAKSHVPAGVRASVKAVIEEVVSERTRDLYTAILDGVNSGPRNAHNYLRLCAEYTDGKPDANVNIRTQFREDEVASAERSLERKMNILFHRASKVAVLPPAEDAKV